MQYWQAFLSGERIGSFARELLRPIKAREEKFALEILIGPIEKVAIKESKRICHSTLVYWCQ
jgi:hypothetical protein